MVFRAFRALREIPVSSCVSWASWVSCHFVCCVCVAHAANIGARGQTAPEEKGVSGRKGRFHPNLQERPLKNGCRGLQVVG